jgi:hypothetical protein
MVMDITVHITLEVIRQIGTPPAITTPVGRTKTLGVTMNPEEVQATGIGKCQIKNGN